MLDFLDLETFMAIPESLPSIHLFSNTELKKNAKQSFGWTTTREISFPLSCFSFHTKNIPNNCRFFLLIRSFLASLAYNDTFCQLIVIVCAFLSSWNSMIRGEMKFYLVNSWSTYKTCCNVHSCQMPQDTA